MNDLFGEDPAERIAELEKENEQLRKHLSEVVRSALATRPAMAQFGEYMTAFVDSMYAADNFLREVKGDGK